LQEEGDFGCLPGVLALRVSVVAGISAGVYERNLMTKLENELSGFNTFERPVEDEQQPLKVEFGLTLQQIIDVVSL